MKTCTKCGETKTFAHFPFNRRMNDGHDSWCFECRNAARRQRRARDIERHRLRERGYDAKRQRDPERIAYCAALRDLRSRHPEALRAAAEAARIRKGIANTARAYRSVQPVPALGLTKGIRRNLITAHRYANDPRFAGLLLAKGARRRAELLRAAPPWADPDRMAEVYAWARHLTQRTGYSWDVDHMVPLRHPLVCGLHCESNLTVLPAAANRRKGNRYWPDMPE